ncbi:hypothetical protein [Christiangramia sp. SM2212]|uniref:DUF7847 domain-containing protein n=1 Tax=Christiangramia sediminicola TaxID=3073267 RepID=A0ABU1ENM4_9FLAO|nr:hypothetical protein [Christiangramia sp. SM2212]MDR5589985.1 hypothetical protein [Christiangramia sp. SM2212]
MNQDYIEFKKQRELGEIISITFKFLRENYKSGGKIFLKLVGPAFLLLIAAVTYYAWSTLGTSFLGTAGLNMSDFIISGGLLILAYLLYMTSMTGTIYHIILSYINNNGTIDTSEVSAGLKHDFGKILLVSLISWALILAGTLLLVIPGIYVAIPLSLASAVLVFRNNGAIDSISDCFDLVKSNWWSTFGTLFCVGIIVYLISLVFQLPTIVYMMVKAFVSANEQSASGSFTDQLGTGYIILNVITTIIQYLVYSITPVAIAFIYFNLNEKKNYTGTYETIQNLGKQ